MAIYTGVADANGDFNIPFSTNYTSGQKVTVTAEKDAETKTIELFAPGDTLGGGAIQFSGSLDNFPSNVGNITLSGFTGVLQANAFEMTLNAMSMAVKCTGLSINDGITSIANRCFYNWRGIKYLHLPNTISSIGNSAFYSCRALLEIIIPDSCMSIGMSSFADCLGVLKLTIGAGVTSINAQGFESLTSCDEIIVKPSAPPTITSNTFNSLKSTCVFKVPAASLSAYKTAANWSAFAARIQAI